MLLSLVLVSCLNQDGLADKIRKLNATEPAVILVHGLFYRAGMKSLQQFLLQQGFSSVELLSDDAAISSIVERGLQAKKDGRPLVLIGHSQGGFNIVRASRGITAQGETVDLAISLGAGGLGRWVLRQWFQDPRSIPTGVRRFKNYFTEGDVLGTDAGYDSNLAHPTRLEHPNAPEIENIFYSSELGVGHFDLTLCTGAVRPAVRALFCEPLLNDLKSLRTSR